MYRVCIVGYTGKVWRMGRDGAGMGQGKYGEDTGKVTDYKGALWVMT